MVSRRGSGEGAIFQRANGLWVGRVELPTYDGTRRRKEVTAKTKAALVKKLRQIKDDLEARGDIITGNETLEQWLNVWLDTIAAKRVRPTTLNTYRSQIRSVIVPAIGQVRLDKLAQVHIRRMHDSVQGSSTYALNAHRVLSRALKDAEREGRITRNPAELVDPPRQSRTSLEALTVNEAQEVLNALAALERRNGYNGTTALIATFLLTGQRRGEVLGLERDRISDALDVSWQLQRINNIATAPADFEYRHVRGKLYLTRPKSRAGWRVIPLVEPLAGILTRHAAQMTPNDHGLLFTRPDGHPIEPSAISRDWPALLRATGVTDKRVRLHDLRHTTVDLLYLAGVPEDVIQQIVGHSTRSMTRAYKSRGDLTRITHGMNALSALFTPPTDAVSGTREVTAG